MFDTPFFILIVGIAVAISACGNYYYEHHPCSSSIKSSVPVPLALKPNEPLNQIVPADRANETPTFLLSAPHPPHRHYPLHYHLQLSVALDGFK